MDFLKFQVRDLDETVAMTEAVRPYVEQDLSTEDELIDSYVSHVYALIEKSESLSILIDEFLEAKQNDRDLVEQAKDLVSRAKKEIARFQEQRDLEDLGISDETAKIQ